MCFRRAGHEAIHDAIVPPDDLPHRGIAALRYHATRLRELFQTPNGGEQRRNDQLGVLRRVVVDVLANPAEVAAGLRGPAHPSHWVNSRSTSA